MDEMLADGLESMADLDKGLKIVIRARGECRQPHEHPNE